MSACWARSIPIRFNSVNNLAGLYQAQGRYGEAEPLFSARSRPASACSGQEHPDTLTSVNNLAALYQAQGRYGEAEPLYKRALEAYERVLGREHPDTLTSVNNLAGSIRPRAAMARPSRSISARWRPASACWARSIPIRLQA